MELTIQKILLWFGNDNFSSYHTHTVVTVLYNLLSWLSLFCLIWDLELDPEALSLLFFKKSRFIKFEVLASSLGGWFFEASVRLMMFIVFESRVQSQRPLDPSDNMQYWSNFPSNTSSDPTNFTSYCHGTVFYWKGAPGSL